MPPPTLTFSPQPCELTEKIEAAAQLRGTMPFTAPPGAIAGFFGQYRWLSNFATCAVTVEGTTYPSVEHAYQASKTLDRSLRITIAQAEFPATAKSLGRRLPLRPDWGRIQLPMMLALQRAKYSIPALGSRLNKTGNRPLIEANYWRDTYWGAHIDGPMLIGANRLGLCIEAIRSELILPRLER